MRLALASRVKGHLVKQVSGDFAMMEVRSVYDGSHLEELRARGVGLLDYSSSLFPPLPPFCHCLTPLPVIICWERALPLSSMPPKPITPNP